MKLNFRLVTDGLRFPEGPIAMADGSVLVVEIEGARLTRVLPDGSKQVVAELGGGPNGAAIGPDGHCYVCNNGGFNWITEPDGFLRPHGRADSYEKGGIQRVDLATGAAEWLYTECNGVPLFGPNDIVFDARGGMWFTDHGKSYDRVMDRGAIYYARADGTQISRSRLPDDHRQRRRPLAGRHDALRHRDRNRPALGLADHRPRRSWRRIPGPRPPAAGSLAGRRATSGSIRSQSRRAATFASPA